MGGYTSTMRFKSAASGANPGMAASVLSAIFLSLMLLGMMLLAGSSVSLNKCAFETRLSFRLDSSETDDCTEEAELGDTSCVSKGFRTERWKDFDWFVLYSALPLACLVFITIIWYLHFNAMRILWWVMALASALLILVVGGSIGVNTIYWIQCKDWEFCARPKYVFDFTGFVKFRHSDKFWIVHNVALYCMLIGHIGFLIASLYTQYIGSFGIMNMMYSNPNRPAVEGIGAPLDPESPVPAKQKRRGKSPSGQY